MPTAFWLAFERERESVLNTCFERGRTDVSNDTEPMVCTPKKCFPNKNVLQANSLREMSKWWCMSAVHRVFCVMRYSFRMTQRLPVVETSTEIGRERSFSYLAVPSVSYISISVRFSFPPHPPNLFQRGSCSGRQTEQRNATTQPRSQLEQWLLDWILTLVTRWKRSLEINSRFDLSIKCQRIVGNTWNLLETSIASFEWYHAENNLAQHDKLALRYVGYWFGVAACGRKQSDRSLERQYTNGSNRDRKANIS